MKNKILLFVVVVLGIITLAVISKKNETNHSFFDKEDTIKVKTKEEKIEELKIEDYLVGVLAAEMPASFEVEALKAQAVASRSYALYKIYHNENNEYDILTDVTNQSYITKEEMQEKWGNNYSFYLNKVTNAVKDTEREVMYYKNEIIEAFYFAMSNGATENAQTVFQMDLPYIKSTSSSWDNESLNNFKVTTKFSKKEFCSSLKLENCDTIVIGDINYSASHRINNIVINNKTFSGTEVRSILNLRSTDFEIDIEEEKVAITTKGYGHGVGMSQYGANGMAKEGYNYKDILNYYYNDITINKMV